LRCRGVDVLEVRLELQCLMDLRHLVVGAVGDGASHGNAISLRGLLTFITFLRRHNDSTVLYHPTRVRSATTTIFSRLSLLLLHVDMAAL